MISARDAGCAIRARVVALAGVTPPVASESSIRQCPCEWVGPRDDVQGAMPPRMDRPSSTAGAHRGVLTTLPRYYTTIGWPDGRAPVVLSGMPIHSPCAGPKHVLCGPSQVQGDYL